MYILDYSGEKFEFHVISNCNLSGWWVWKSWPCKNFLGTISFIQQSASLHSVAFAARVREALKQSRSRNSHQRFYKERSVLKNFAIFTGKQLTWSLVSRWRPATLWKRCSNTVLSSEYCKNFKNTCFEEHLQSKSTDWFIYDGNIVC